MFRKLVSNLAFSPALVGQLGFYAKRLRKEEATRRVGLVFTALALIVQSFAVFSPPEAANASSPSDMIPGGVQSLSDYLHHYDQNTNNIKDLYTILGISRADIAAAHETTINSKDIPVSWGMTSHFSYAQGDRTYTIKTSNGGLRTYHYQPLRLWDSLPYTIRYGSTYQAYVGITKSGMWFALMKVCGNLNLKVYPPAPKCPTGTVGTYPNCVPPKCPTGTTGTYPNCTKPKTPVAACTMLKITKLINNYQLDATSSADGGATIISYMYAIKRDGTVIDTITKPANGSLTNTATTTQTKKGTYTVELTVKTSVGDKTSDDCVKTFSIPAPQMCPLNPKLRKDSPECQPCPGDTTIWIKDKKCTATLVNTKSANNTTQNNIDATTTTARAGDKIVYTLNVENTGKASTTATISEDLGDVVEYAEVIDTGGGTYNADTKTLTWPQFTIAPGAKQSRLFTVKVFDTIPAMGQGVSNKTSYDCRMDNTFGNGIDITVDCPIQKQVVEQTAGELPHTGPRENMLFAGIVFAIVVYFYARSRQVKKEVRLIRRDLNAGTI